MNITISHAVRALNYKRLAARSIKKANIAMDKAIQIGFLDTSRIQFENEFAHHWATQKKRLAKALTLKLH